MAVILIVEDDFFTREMAEFTIQDWGHNTLSASDVDEALSILGSAQRIDALFTDIHLKSAARGGYELAHHAIRLWPKLRVLYTSGNSVADQMSGVFVEGAHFVSKPYTQHELQNSMKELLAASF